MKNILLIVCLLLGIGVQAQVKIGDNPQNIDPSAVLELESTSKVLVITRVTTDQMNAITPPSGALVYNTDLGCLHYYKDAEWVNVCDSVAEPLSISAGDSTIVITPNNNAYEITVGEIRGDQIVDATIFGQDLANGSITQAKLGLNSVGPAQLRENSVGNTQLAELSVAGVNIIDGTVQPKHMQPGGFNQLLFTNDKGQVLWVSREQIGATIADQQTIKGKGIAADPLKVADTVMQRIAKNEKDLNLKENLINKSDNTNLGTSDIKYPTQRAVKLYVDNKFDEIGGAVDDNQELSLNESNILAIERGNSVDLSLYQQSLTRSGNTISLSNGGGNIDLSDLGGGGGGGGEGGVDGAITKVELNNANLQFTGINGGFSGAINLANMPGYGAISKVELNGNNLVFTGNGKAFNGTIPLPSGGGSGLYLDEGELSGAGTESDPLRIKPAAGTLQYLITDENQVVRWEPIPEATGGGSGTVKADGKTITGTGAEGNEFRINPNIPGRFLTTDPISGEVVWADLPPGTGGGGGGNNTVDPDGITIMGDGSVDNRLRVKPGNPNQILRTNADGSAVNWVDFVLQGGENVTVEGNGTLAKPYVISAPNGGEGGGTENQTISAFTFNETTNELTLSLSGGSTGTADLTSLSGGGGDTPNLESILTTGQSAGSKQIKDLLNPTEPQDAATKDYVDSSTSQLTNLAFDNTSGILTLTNPATAGNKIDLSGLGGGTDNQQLTLEAGNILTLERGGSVDLSSLNGEGGSDGAITLVELNDSSLNFTGSGNGFTGSIDLSALPGGGADQDLASVLAGGTDAGEKQIKNLLNPSEAQDAATKDYVDSSTTQLTDLSYDNENHILTLTNPATAGKEIDLSGLLGGSNSLIVDGSILTGEGIEGNPLKIAPSSTPGQILKTDLNGDVIWDDLPAGTGNTVITDGETINGNGVDIDLSVPTGGITTLQILDGTILSEDISDKTIELAKIKPLNGPLSSNQMLITNSATGEVEWTPVNASGGGEVNTGINIGSAGIGTYVDNLGSVLQFRNINSGTGIVTVTEDPVNNNIDLDIAPTSITGDKIANESILAQHFNNMGATDGQILKWDATANAGIGGWILAEDRTDGSGIQNLNNGKILIGDNGNNPIEIDISGDATLNNTGVLTIENEAVTTAKIAPNAIETQHLSDMGATDGQILKWDATVNAGTGGWILAEDRTDGSGIQNLNNGKILIGDNDNNPIEIDISGDATLDNTGVLTIADEVIETKHLSDMGAADGQILKWDATVNAGLGGWILAEDRTDGSGIKDLNNGKILIGDNSNAPIEIDISGDATLDNTGVLTIENEAVTSGKIAANAIETQHLSDMGATDGQILKWDVLANAGAGGWILTEDLNDGSSIQDLASGKILIGDNGNNPIEIEISGDATLDNTGILTIENEAVTSGKIAANAIETQHLSDMGAADGQILKWDATVNAGLGGWILAEDRTDGSGIKDLNNGKILIGDNSNAPIEIDISGDATLDNTGVLTIENEAVTSGKIAANAIETQHLSDMGATDGQILKWDELANAGAGGWILTEDLNDGSSIQDLASGKILIGDNDNNPIEIEISGDATLDNTGILTIENEAVTSGKIAANAIETQHLSDMGATDGQILKWDELANAGAGGWTLTEDLNDGSSIQDLASGKILIGDNGNNPIEIEISGDATLDNTGILTIENEAVTSGKIAANAIETQHLSDMGATDGQILKWDELANAGAGGWTLTEDLTDGSGIKDLSNGKILIGDIDNIPVEITISGDATLNNLGVLTIENDAITSEKIVSKTIKSEHLSPMGAAENQVLKWNGTIWAPAEDDSGTLPTLTNAEVIIGDNAGNPAARTITGDATLNNTGILTIVNQAVTSEKIANNAVTTDKIADGNVIESKINKGLDGQVLTTVGGAVKWEDPSPAVLAANSVTSTMIADGAIKASHIAPGAIKGGPGGAIALNSIRQGDIAPDAIGSSELDADSVGESELKDGAVTTDKILNGTILDADINAGADIAGTKIAPNFGAQNIVTTGTLAAGNTTVTGTINATGTILTTAGLSVGADILLNGNLVLPDYVFQKYFQGYSTINNDYQFKSLAEIEAFVKQHNHLPGIKSAEEVKKDGFWNLSESNLQNLEKIEELFLHTIEQEKKIEQLKKENENLSSELHSIKKDLEEIKSLLKNNNQKQ